MGVRRRGGRVGDEAEALSLRWAFDVELVHLCERLDIPVAEVAVRWQEIEGSKLIQSKLDVVTTSLTMLRDMVCVRLCYELGLWKPRLP